VRREHLNKAASAFVNAVPDVTPVINAILTVWAEERENPIDAVLKQVRESDGIITPTLTEEDEKLLGEITERNRNLLLACRAQRCAIETVATDQFQLLAAWHNRGQPMTIML
jgi:hypothetical protein